MIRTLTGILSLKKQGMVVINVGGVGFQVAVPDSTLADLPALSQKAELFCHLHVREDALELYGLKSEKDLRLFEFLISVNGIGPKSALNIMNVAQSDQLIAAINEGRAELLVKASGVGKKTAERVILDLKGKLDFGDGRTNLSLLESDIDLEETLVGLGFSKQQAKATISRIDPKIKDFNERLKEALKRK